MTRDELKLETEHLDLLDKLTAAKESGDVARVKRAKVALHDFRVEWRTIRDAFNPPAEGTAAPEATKAARTRKAGS